MDGGWIGWISAIAFTQPVTLAERRSRLLIENIQGLRTAFREVKAAHPFTMEVIVILPDYLL